MLNKYPHPMHAFPWIAGIQFPWIRPLAEMLNWVMHEGAEMDEILGQHGIVEEGEAHVAALKDV